MGPESKTLNKCHFHDSILIENLQHLVEIGKVFSEGHGQVVVILQQFGLDTVLTQLLAYPLRVLESRYLVVLSHN